MAKPCQAFSPVLSHAETQLFSESKDEAPHISENRS